jgi:hypothetical protein
MHKLGKAALVVAVMAAFSVGAAKTTGTAMQAKTAKPRLKELFRHESFYSRE